MKLIPELNDNNFATEVLAAKLPVVVDFHAQWCGPCKMLAPTLEEIARDHASQVKVVKVDVDTNPELAQRYDIQAMPTLLYFRDGQVRDITRGAVGKRAILAKVEALSGVSA